MKRYEDLISQTFEFPQDEFRVENHELLFNEIPLMDIIKEHGTPLKLSYLPKDGIHSGMEAHQTLRIWIVLCKGSLFLPFLSNLPI